MGYEEYKTFRDIYEINLRKYVSENKNTGKNQDSPEHPEPVKPSCQYCKHNRPLDRRDIESFFRTCDYFSDCHDKNLCWFALDNEKYAKLKENQRKNPHNVQKHSTLCRELNSLYAEKNADYGDSFHKSFLDEGWAMVRIRLGDKYNRICTLTRRDERNVADESLRDTLIDLADYALMSVMELDRAEEDKRRNRND